MVNTSFNKAIKIAERFSIPLAERVAEESFYWDGRTLALMRTPRITLSAESVLHEVCHWIVATSEERTYPEYGLVARPNPEDHLENDEAISRRFYVSRMLQRGSPLTKDERRTRESASQIINLMLGLKHSIGPVFENNIGWHEVPTLLKNVHTDWDRDGVAWLQHRNVDLVDLVRFSVE